MQRPNIAAARCKLDAAPGMSYLWVGRRCLVNPEMPQPHERILVMADKTVITDCPINKLLTERWSPYAFDQRPVLEEDLRCLFEAARWAPSSYNEQPWSYIVATKATPDEFQRLLSCLVDGNQVWAKNAPVLALGIVSLKFARNGENNRAAVHDLGLASANLSFEATARGLCIHQMIGILPEKAREVYRIPDGFEAWTGLAIGHPGDPNKLPAEIAKRDAARRPRKPVREFVFGGKWGNPSPTVLNK